MAGADLGTLTAKLQLNTSGAEQAVKKLGGMFGPLGDAIAAIATTLIVVGAVSVDLAAKFQSSTDLMAAQAGISAKAASKIGDAFLSTGGKSTFSAQTIMAAFGPVSGVIATAAGHALSASEAMTFMSAAMNLAEATGQPLADTTSALAKVMLQYGINVGQAAGTSDLLFNVSRKLGIPIATLGDAVDKLKYKLGPLAPTLQDVGSLLLDLGEHHGPTGSRGLLLVSTAFNTLLGNSKATNAEIAKTGLHVFKIGRAHV